MMEKNMAEKIKEIQMPEDMQKRIIRNCCMKSEEKRMNKGCQFLKKPMVAIASLVLCLCLMSVTVLAATGKLQGFFVWKLRKSFVVEPRKTS